MSISFIGASEFHGMKVYMSVFSFNPKSISNSGIMDKNENTVSTAESMLNSTDKIIYFL